MGKLLLVMTFIGFSILLIFGFVNPDSPVMWLASTSIEFTILRLVLIAILFAMFVTNPPRNVIFRAVVGATCMVLAGWALFATYENSMKILDTMMILESTIICGLMVLERGLHSRYLTAFQDNLVNYAILSKQLSKQLSKGLPKKQPAH